MSEPTQIITRVPQNDDSVALLLARLLAVQSQRVTGTALAAATRNSTTQSAIIDCTGFRSIIVFFRVTSVPGVDTVRVTIRGIDPVSGVAMALLQAGTVSAVGATTVIAGPGAGSAMALPDQIRIEITHSASPGGNFDYSVGYCLIP